MIDYIREEVNCIFDVIHIIMECNQFAYFLAKAGTKERYSWAFCGDL